MSIDEERKSFHPVIWNPIENDVNEKMKQVWFSGVHTDVGGGYPEEDLSNIALQWMIQEAIDKNLLIYDKKALESFMASNPDVNGIMHNEQKKLPGKLLKRMKRNWDKATHGEPSIHESVLKRTKDGDNSDTSKYAPWIFDIMDKDKPFIEPWKNSQPANKVIRRKPVKR